MATDPLDLSSLSQYTSAFGTLYESVKWILIICVVAALAWWFLEYTKYNKKVIIKKQAGNQNKVIFGKAKQIKDKDGTVWWQIKAPMIKLKVRPPEPHQIELLKGGKEFAIGTLTPNGDFIWQDNKSSGISYALTPADKTILAHQFLSAEGWKKKNPLQYIMELAPLATLILICVAQLVFWGEYIKPATALAESNKEVAKMHTEQARILQEISQNVRRIDAENAPVTSIATPNKTQVIT